MKRFLSVLLTIILLISAVPMSLSVSAASVSFKDVKKSAWYASHVDYAVKNDIFSGTSSTTFSPNQKMTRAQFVQVFANLSGVNTSNKKVKTKFSDVPSGQWYAPAVKWASENGVVSGVGSGKFAPVQPVTREQMCVMLVNYVEKFQKKSLKSTANTKTFNDDKKIASWAKKAVYKCAKAGLVNGVGENKFNPQGTTTRAEGATFFSNFHKYLSRSHNCEYKARTVDPTCSSVGYTKYTCVCGENYYSNIINATGHKYTEKVTSPTCTMAGYTTHTCRVCGDTYTDSNINKTGHSWGAWITVIAPEVGKNGQEIRTCSACGSSETKIIPAIQEDITKKWFVNQYNIAKQQYINSLNGFISIKQAKIDDLRDDASALYVNYMKEVQRIRERYAGLSGTLEAALRNAQLNYNNSAKVYTDQINSLESEIADIENEIANPNVDNILAIVTKNCNISSREVYEYYNKYSDSLS